MSNYILSAALLVLATTSLALPTTTPNVQQEKINVDKRGGYGGMGMGIMSPYSTMGMGMSGMYGGKIS